MNGKELDFSGCSTEDDVYDVLNAKACPECGGPLGFSENCVHQGPPEFYKALDNIENIRALEDPDLKAAFKEGGIHPNHQIAFINASRNLHNDIYISYWALSLKEGVITQNAVVAAHKLCHIYLRFIVVNPDLELITDSEINDLWCKLKELDDIFPNMGIADSDVRERMFELLAQNYNCDYHPLHFQNSGALAQRCRKC